MSGFDPASVLRSAAERLRSGQVLAARTMLDVALSQQPDHPALLSFAGLVACEIGDLAAGADHLRRAIMVRPDDATARVNLVRALVDLGRRDEAEAMCLAGDRTDPRLRRFLGYFRQGRGEDGAAAADYQAVVTAFPADAQSWNNLGNARSAIGEVDAAITAFDRAIALRPSDPMPRINALKALAKAERKEERLRVAQAAVRACPRDVAIWFELGLAEVTLRRFDAAEAAYRTALSLDPEHLGAWLELGLMLENLNRIDDLEALIEEAEAAAFAAPEIDFLRAWALRRRGRFDEALPFAEAAPDTIDPIRRMNLLGEIYDRLGDATRAFDAFEKMKAATARIVAPAMIDEGARFLADIRRATTQLPAVAKARTTYGADRRLPIFIAGFPRSGTTLLDTLLMNVPGLHVLEELPLMGAVEAAMGDVERLATLGEDELERLRRVYFDQLDRLAPAPEGATIVDKFPLHMARAGLIYRLFPGAKIIFAQRHPCDVLLSCFISNFQPNRAMVHFLTLEGAATLYDAAFEHWTRACAELPLAVHTVRYERLIADMRGEMRALLSFLDRPWTDAVTDNQGSAARRGHIRTASYAQVGEPIYSRSAGRWQRYRRQLALVLPILEPWIEPPTYSLNP